MSAPGGHALAGRSIVVTRPADQSEALVRLIHDEGGVAIVFPAIEIVDPADPARFRAVLDRLDTFDIAIFVSPNAASRGMRAISGHRDLPARIEVIAVGQGTARELRRCGVATVLTPEDTFDSEAVLDLPALASVQGRRIVIFRGEGGRALIGDTLAARGASVEFAECYRRAKPGADVEPLMQSCARGEIDALVATSSEGLRNLHDMLGDQGWQRLARTTLFVPHARIASTARALGLTAVIVTPPLDDGIMKALIQHFASSR